MTLSDEHNILIVPENHLHRCSISGCNRDIRLQKNHTDIKMNGEYRVCVCIFHAVLELKNQGRYSIFNSNNSRLNFILNEQLLIKMNY